MLKNGDYYKFFKLRHHPNTQEPWVEVEYSGGEDIHLFIDFVNRFTNLSRLDPEKIAFLFRGQSDDTWRLLPKLWRHLPDVEPAAALMIEYDSILFFRRRAHLHLDAKCLPTPDSQFEWLPLMQHYGAPTRMLDWTTSFTVALYFAVADEPLNKPGAVWFFDVHRLIRWMEQKDYSPHAPSKYSEIMADETSFVKYGTEEARPNIWPYYPDSPTERMLRQQGILTFSERPCCEQTDLIGNCLWELSSSDQSCMPLMKMVIPRDAKPKLREYLNKLDISAATLFAGLDGLGRAVSEIMKVESETFHKKATP